METLMPVPYMERTEETSTGGPPSIVLMISVTTVTASPLYCWSACLEGKYTDAKVIHKKTMKSTILVDNLSESSNK